MDKKNSAWTAYLPNVLAIWFFAGMPLTLMLSGLYTVAGIPTPPLIVLLCGMIYLSGGVLAGLWSCKSLQNWRRSLWNLVGSLIVLTASIGFLIIGIIFAIKGILRL